MNINIRSKRIKLKVLFLCVCLMIVSFSGCSAFTQALAREAMDDGKHATIKNKSFFRHFSDSVLEGLSGIQPTVDKSKN